MATEEPTIWRRLFVELNIDVLFNPFIPKNFVGVLPNSIGHWLGYRAEKQQEPPVIARFPVIFLATVAGLCLVGGVFNYAPDIVSLNPPTLIASLGASAILDYNAIYSPLSQPRNIIVGHTLSAIVGVGISKLFQLNAGFQHIDWVSAAVGCACSSIAMSLTNCLHPPGGATAVLASADTQVRNLGWWFPPLILLASVLMTAVACIFNNIARRYPLHWWTDAEVGQRLPYASSREKRKNKQSDQEAAVVKEQPREKGDVSEGSEHSLQAGNAKHTDTPSPSRHPQIWSIKSQLPADMELTASEWGLLERLEDRLKQRRRSGSLTSPIVLPLDLE